MTSDGDLRGLELGHGWYGYEQGQGEAVLWLHGYTMDSSIWQELWSSLPGYRHMGVDLPGHGQSRALRPGDTLPGIAAELLQLARTYEARHLAGVSFGSIVALEMALQAPDWLKSLLLAAPTISGDEIDPHAQVKNRELMDLHRAGACNAMMTDCWLSSPPDIFTGLHQLNPQKAEQIRGIVERHSWAELELSAWRVIAEYQPNLAGLTALACPAMVLVGENDMPVFKRQGYKLSRGIAGARRVVLESAGHLPLLELPEDCASIVAEHLCAGCA